MFSWHRRGMSHNGRRPLPVDRNQPLAHHQSAIHPLRRWEQQFGRNKPLPVRAVTCSRCHVPAGMVTMYRTSQGWMCRECAERP